VPFSQHHPSYADRRVGTGYQTIEQIGCLLCSATDMLVASGVTTNPGHLNRWLARNGGFVSSNLFVFGAVEPLGVRLEAVIDCHAVPAPMDRVEATLEAGGWALAMVDFRPWTPVVDQHWVRLIGSVDGREDYLIMDPWLPPGAEVFTLMTRYARPSWPAPWRAIFRLALYRPDPVPSSASVEVRRPTPVQRRRFLWNRKRA
jgi:hypothetical protein